MSGVGLRPRQALFASEYLVDLNATRAAVRAGYSPATARQMGAENLTKPVIAGAIDAAKQARSERLEITQDDVLRGLHQEATRTGEGTSHAARVSAWALLGKHLGMFAEKLDVTVQSGLAARLEAAVARQNLAGLMITDGLNAAVRWSRDDPIEVAAGSRGFGAVPRIT